MGNGEWKNENGNGKRESVNCELEIVNAELPYSNQLPSLFNSRHERAHSLKEQVLLAT